MSRTIENLKKLKSFHNGSYGADIDKAIKALEILEEFEKAQIITGGRFNGRTHAYKCGLEDGKCKALEQSKIAQWILKGDVYPGWKYCSKCKEPWTFDCGTPNYCPKCGAKMIEKESI